MVRFECPTCSGPLFFDNTTCTTCRSDVAYDPGADVFVVGSPTCSLRDTVEHCNWVSDGALCQGCALDTGHEPTAERAAFQAAKRRTLRQLARLGVDPAERLPQLRFELRAGTPDDPVVTGHADGLITLDTSEADPAHREEVRTDLGEPYRTPLGHVRHELGHWWWASAIDDRFTTDDFRARFGDETADYQEALRTHYARPDDGGWRDEFVSHYAASHPWEDFAESFAHYLHVTDTFETAVAHGGLDSAGDTDWRSIPFDTLYTRWVPVTVALNELNRSMGTPDPYPFVPPPAAIDKIGFVAASLGRP